MHSVHDPSRVLHAHVVGERTLGISGLPPDEMFEMLREHLPDTLSIELFDDRRTTSLTWDLSERERAVLGLIGLGLTNVGVAETLFLSLNTVKTYIRSAYRKIDATTRSEAVLWAIRHGLDDEARPRIER